MTMRMARVMMLKKTCDLADEYDDRDDYHCYTTVRKETG